MPDHEAKDSLVEKSTMIELMEDDNNSDDSGYDSEDSDGSQHSETLSSTQTRNEYNVLLLGTAQAGKSALVSRFMDTEVFLKIYHETIVDDYH